MKIKMLEKAMKIEARKKAVKIEMGKKYITSVVGTIVEITKEMSDPSGSVLYVGVISKNTNGAQLLLTSELYRSNGTVSNYGARELSPNFDIIDLYREDREVYLIFTDITKRQHPSHYEAYRVCNTDEEVESFIDVVGKEAVKSITKVKVTEGDFDKFRVCIEGNKR